jgi:enamine deaminase RidA (YjgF/YER057c/UK114 family)
MKNSKPMSRREAALGGAAALSVLSTTKAAAQSPSIQRINPKELLSSRNYTQVVAATGGRTVYVSGQVSANEKGEIVGKEDLKAQSVQVFANLKAALASAGALPKDVVKMMILVPNFKGADDIASIRDARSAFFAGVEPPASTFVGVSALANPDWLIEIEMIAVVA